MGTSHRSVVPIKDRDGAVPKAGAPAAFTRTATTILAILAGILAATAAVQLAGRSWKELALGMAALAVIPLAALSRQPKILLLSGWILSLTYFRVWFPISSMAGFQGFYVTAADAAFVAVFGYWAFEVIVLRRPLRPWGPGIAWCVLPFVVVCFLSALLAERTDWALYETIRVAKIPLILLFCRYNIGRDEWWPSVAVLGLSVLGQSALGILQVSRLVGSYQLEEWDVGLRANGTLAHASIFCGYMLLLTPLFLALAVGFRNRMLAVLAAVPGLAGLAGIGFSLSRIPWGLAFLEAAVLTMGLIHFRRINLKQAIGVWSVCLALGGLAAVPFLDRIRSRISSDMDTAVEWRWKMNEVGVAMIQDRPFFGIGLANFPLYLRTVNMEFGDNLDLALEGILKRAGTQGEVVKGFHWVWVPHNLYVLLLTETGVLGLIAFLAYLGGGVRIAVRALRVSDDVFRAAGLGLVVGGGGLLVYMMTDWALWLDPVLFTFALVVSLLNNAPAVTAASQGFQLATAVGTAAPDPEAEAVAVGH